MATGPSVFKKYGAIPFGPYFTQLWYKSHLSLCLYYPGRTEG